MKLSHLTVCLLSILLANCKSDNPKTKTLLAGRWEIKYGELNGQVAPSLERFYFQFDGANMTTNFNEAATDETVPFELKGDNLLKKSTPPIEFDIKDQTDSTLEMTTEMRGFDFKLVLRKATIQ